VTGVGLGWGDSPSPHWGSVETPGDGTGDGLRGGRQSLGLRGTHFPPPPPGAGSSVPPLGMGGSGNGDGLPPSPGGDSGAGRVRVAVTVTRG
jgi:hypothetical protein